MPTQTKFAQVKSAEELWKILISFGRVGLFALGGGNGMIKMISEEAVDIRKWLSNDEFGSLLGMTFLFPGLTACKLSGMIGYRVAGIAGLIIAALAINIPGIVMTAVCFLFLLNYTSVPIVKELLLGDAVCRHGAHRSGALRHDQTGREAPKILDRHLPHRGVLSRHGAVSPSGHRLPALLSGPLRRRAVLDACNRTCPRFDGE